MRRFISWILMLLLGGLPTIPAGAQSPQPRKILDDMLNALGGQTYLDVDDMHTVGRFYQFKRGELTGGDNFEDYIKFPLMERTEFGRQKAKEIQINNGDKGWKITPKEKEAK